MTQEKAPKEKFSRSFTFKGMMIAILTFLLLIPSCMVQELIRERQHTRNEAVSKIDAKWSHAQVISGPVLSVPYTVAVTDNGKTKIEERIFNIAPEKLVINAELFPEERHYGIYKTILYKSTAVMSGEFSPAIQKTLPKGDIDWSRAYIKFGLSDLRGISEDIRFGLNGKTFGVHAAGQYENLISEVLIVNADNIDPDITLAFNCRMELKGSNSINFLPVGRTTSVSVGGAWPSPGFIGNYTPEYTLDEDGFKADWNVLHFNRSIPDVWIGNSGISGSEVSFGVNLVDTVDIYQQNMRSAKYALMFIALTFVVFFFVEIISRKRIHPIQYLLVGVALILFYSLLLSISEPLGFGWAYLISSVATICLISTYASAIFKNKKLTFLLAAILAALYIFLYVILQLEDVALLAGSIGLFVILGIIMYFSQRIKWYGETE